MSMSTPILSALTVLTLLLAATIEILAQRSASHGGLALSPSLDEIPRYAMWSYLYAPTVVAVLYSLIWSWVDLDVKRMQPWFELSKEGGATAEGSLFLDYPFDFVAVAPLKAFKRRHWPVVLAGTTMMIVFWTITPLQSAILGTGVIMVTESAPVYAASVLAPVEKQVDLLHTELLNNGYAVGWLGQSMPPFMTREYGTLPVYINDTRSGAPESNWTVATTSYTTDLSCSPARAEPRSVEDSKLWYILNNKGCNMTLSFNVHSNNSMLYIGYYSSPYSDYALRSPDCPLSADSTNNFLSIWRETYNRTGDSPGSMRADFNVSAMYCETSYFKQDVLLTVNSATHQLVKSELIPLSAKKKLGRDEFNSTAFEFLLANGMAEDPGNRDKPFDQPIEQHPRLEGSGIEKPVSNMVPYALAGHMLPREAYADQQVLAKAYTRAHKYLFSLAVDQLLVNDTNLSPGKLGNVTFPQTGIIVSRTFSAAVEALLLLVAIVTVALLWLIRSAPCALDHNPSSIRRIGNLLTGDASMLKCLQTVDNADDESLGSKLQSARMALVRREYRGRIDTYVVRLDRAYSFGRHDAQGEPSRDGFYRPIRPLALRKYTGLLFVVVIMGATGFLAYLKTEEVSNRGTYSECITVEEHTY